jgi:hypothetical protein
MGRLTEGVFAAFDDDDFRWWISRQADAGDAGGVHKTLGHRDGHGVNAWFAARDERDEVGDYAADLDRAWKLADASAGTAEAAGLQCRYALLRALLGDLGSRFRPELAALLVGHAVWTREQALAWGDLSFAEESALAEIAHAIDDATGTGRDELVSRAVAASARYTTEGGPTRLAVMAQTLAPHEQAALLDGIIADTDKGGKLEGLVAIIPHLPAELLPRARAAARAFESADPRAEALAAVARALPRGQQDDAYAEVLATARDELARTPTPDSVATPGVRLLEALAAILPGTLLGSLLELAGEADLTGYDLQTVIGAVACRQAETDPAAAARHAEALSTGPRDKVLAAVARAHAKAGEVAEAIAAAAAIKVDLVRTPALVAIAQCVSDIEDPALVQQVRRLSPYHRTEVVRALAAHADRPAPTLLELAEAIAEPRDRLRAIAAMAPALTPADIAAAFAALISPNALLDTGALADLAPRLTADQARTALDTLTEASLLDRDAVTALSARLAELGAPDEALARVAHIADPAQLFRPEELATLARHLPERLLPAVRAAVQPSTPAEERVAARTALLTHLPAGRAADVIAEVASLNYPAERVRALAPLVAAGQPTAEPLLTAALRESYPSRHPDRHKIALQAVRAVAAGHLPLSEQFIAAVQELPSPRHRLLALLALASSRRRTAARTASEAVVALLLTGDWKDALRDATIKGADTTHLAEAALALPSPKAFAAVVADLAPLLQDDDRSAILYRARAIDAPAPRLLALAALSDAAPNIAVHIAATECARLHEWSSNTQLLPLGLQVLSAGGIEPDQELVERAWAAVVHISSRARWLAHVTTLAETPGTAVPAALVKDVFDVALHLDTNWRWPALAALAPRLDPDDLARAVSALSQAPFGEDAAGQAAAACAIRAAELHDEALMLASLAAAPKTLGDQPAVTAAIDRLSPDMLRSVASHAAQDQDSLAAIAVRAATYDDHQLALEVLSRITSPTSREEAMTGMAERAAPSWAEDLLPSIRGLWEGPRAEALAALLPRIPAERRPPLVEEAIHAAEGYRHASAPRRRHILSRLAPELARLPPARVAQLWANAMRVTSLRGRAEVLVDLAALADPLVQVLGSPVALELDDAIQVGGGLRWP